LNLALTSADLATARVGIESELSEREWSYLGSLPEHARLLPRMRPEIEQRLEQLRILAQRDGLLVLTAKGRSLLRHMSCTGTQPVFVARA
jgi:hypothetical protein